jgi:GT2 family glycosyltransferase
MSNADTSRISLVVLSHNRARQLAETLAQAISLPERPRVIVVDNGSDDGSQALVASRFPEVELIALPRNHGAAARNIGARRASTPFVAFADDDTCWMPGSLQRGCDLLEAYPRIGALNARVLVGLEQREAPICRRMHESPLPSDGLPGPVLAGFVAGATVFRRSAFLQAGGYEPRFFIGGEEGLVALDLMTLGFAIVYAPTLVVCHFPAANLNTERRRALIARNDLWTAWLRRHPRVVLRRTLAFAAAAGSTLRAPQALFDAMRGLPWALRNRRVVPPHVEALCELVDDRREVEAQDLTADARTIRGPAASLFRAPSAIRSSDAKHGGLL